MQGISGGACVGVEEEQTLRDPPIWPWNAAERVSGEEARDPGKQG